MHQITLSRLFLSANSIYRLQDYDLENWNSCLNRLFYWEGKKVGKSAVQIAEREEAVAGGRHPRIPRGMKKGRTRQGEGTKSESFTYALRGAVSRVYKSRVRRVHVRFNSGNAFLLS